MPRKGENISKRKDNRWEGRYIIGRRADGRAIYRSVYGNSYSEVRAKLLPLKMEAMKTPAGERFLGTFGEYAELWLVEKARNIKPSTRDHYLRCLQNHILPTLGRRPAQQLCPQDASDFRAGLDQKGLGGGTIRNILRLLGALTKRAALTGAIERDICLDMEIPTPPSYKTEALTLSEQKRVERVALQSENGFAAVLALYTGLRIGELCALRWEDVNLDARVITVNKTVQRLRNHDEHGALTVINIGAPKSESAFRVVPLPDCLLPQLHHLRAQGKGDYVISCRGGLAEPRVVQYRFERLLQLAALRHVNFHALRHTYATRCMELGMDVTTLSKLLGHSSVKMTLDIYTDSLMEHRMQAVRLLDKIAA